MTAFVGTFEHALDDKGRTVVPSAFRPLLAGGAVVAKLERNLGMWLPEVFDQQIETLRQRITAQEITGDELRVFLSEAAEVKPDSQGRIWLPSGLRLHARLEAQVVFVGFDDRIEIWNEESWRGTRVVGDERVVEILETAGR